MSNLWSELDTAKLRKLAKQGLSSRSIAAEMGYKFTRNAIIGKMHRLGISSSVASTTNQFELLESKPVVSREHKYTKRSTKVATTARELPQLEIPQNNVVPFMSLTNRMCRYPVSGEKETTLFCGAATDKGSWCKQHYRIVYHRSDARNGEKVEVRKEPTGLLSDSAFGRLNFAWSVKTQR